MFIKKNDKSYTSKSNNFKAAVLTEAELNSVNGGGGFVWVKGSKKGGKGGVSGGVGYEWNF